MSFCKMPDTQGKAVPASKHEYKPVAVEKECTGICAHTDLGLSLVIQLYEDRNLKRHLLLGITALHGADIPLDAQANLLHWTTHLFIFSLKRRSPLPLLQGFSFICLHLPQYMPV